MNRICNLCHKNIIDISYNYKNSNLPYRLINTELQKVFLVKNLCASCRPKSFAVVSHVWGKNRDNKKQWDIKWQVYNQYNDQFLKICKIAYEDKQDWLWIDTLCIDQREDSNEKLNEIPRMGIYYKRSTVCYVLVHDISPFIFKWMDEYISNIDAFDEIIKLIEDNKMPVLDKESYTDRLQQVIAILIAWFNSVWFTRIWTLQEQKLSKNIQFIGKNKERVDGKKFKKLAKLVGIIEAINTEIEPNLNEIIDSRFFKQSILWSDKTQDITFSNVMCWAYGRKSTKEEDKIYGLYGLLEPGDVDIQYKGIEYAIYSTVVGMIKKGDISVILHLYQPYNNCIMPKPDQIFDAYTYIPTLKIKYKNNSNVIENGIKCDATLIGKVIDKIKINPVKYRESDDIYDTGCTLINMMKEHGRPIAKLFVNAVNGDSPCSIGFKHVYTIIEDHYDDVILRNKDPRKIDFSKSSTCIAYAYWIQKVLTPMTSFPGYIITCNTANGTKVYIGYGQIQVDNVLASIYINTHNGIAVYVSLQKTHHKIRYHKTGIVLSLEYTQVSNNKKEGIIIMP